MMILLSLLLAMQQRPADAPTAEDARRDIQEPLRLARQHSGRLVMLNVTSSTTPEAEHLATGARCRFWYHGIEIRSPWLDDRAIDCSSAGGWVHTGLAIYSLRGPRRPISWGIAPLLQAGSPSLESLAGALTAASLASWSGAQASAAQRRLVRSAGGRQLEVMSFTIDGPGGAPDRTPQTRHNAHLLLIVDGWLFEISAGGPSRYRREADNYAEAGLQRLIESLESAARLPTFRAAP